MRILAIDPGTEHSGMVLFDATKWEMRVAREQDNQDMLRYIRALPRGLADVLCIENIEGMGLTVGKSTFETCQWMGRFQEAWEHRTGEPAHYVGRGDEKIVLCGAKTFIDPQTGKRKGVKDSQIRAALLERFPSTGGGKRPQIGTKKEPGPLYNVKGHAWSALAVALTWLETSGRGKP